MDIKKDVKLSKYTTFHLGGPAKYFVIVKNVDELREALKWAKKNKERYFILGGGSNVLFSDDGFDGLVIKINFIGIELNGEVSVGAGTPLFLTAKRTTDAGLEGLESLAGIPGTVGGAVCNNAGAYGRSLGQVVEKAEIINSKGDIEEVKNDWFNFEYRNSKLKSWNTPNMPILLRIWLKLEKGDKVGLKKKIEEILKDREKKEPKGFCAGCTFKNIKGKEVLDILKKYDFTKEEKERFSTHKAIPVAWFIERAGLKGKKIGGAYIPKEHANYIMNDGSAKTEDILEMIRFVKKEVKKKFKIEVKEEIQIVK